jgi:pimeloyl-ACP methyl ester carboxylesterase
MGGMTAAVVASRGRGLLGGLVLVDPTFLEPERQREVYATDVAEQHRRAVAGGKAGLVADLRARHPHRSGEMVELIAEARLATRLETFEILRPPNPDYRELVRAIEVPTLLVIGDKSVVTEAMARELEGLNARIRTEKIEGAGHGVPFDQPERVGELIASFLRDLE